MNPGDETLVCKLCAFAYQEVYCDYKIVDGRSKVITFPSQLNYRRNEKLCGSNAAWFSPISELFQ